MAAPREMPAGIEHTVVVEHLALVEKERAGGDGRTTTTATRDHPEMVAASKTGTVAVNGAVKAIGIEGVKAIGSEGVQVTESEMVQATESEVVQAMESDRVQATGCRRWRAWW